MFYEFQIAYLKRVFAAAVLPISLLMAYGIITLGLFAAEVSAVQLLLANQLYSDIESHTLFTDRVVEAGTDGQASAEAYYTAPGNAGYEATLTGVVSGIDRANDSIRFRQDHLGFSASATANDVTAREVKFTWTYNNAVNIVPNSEQYLVIHTARQNIPAGRPWTVEVTDDNGRTATRTITPPSGDDPTVGTYDLMYNNGIDIRRIKSISVKTAVTTQAESKFLYRLSAYNYRTTAQHGDYRMAYTYGVSEPAAPALIGAVVMLAAYMRRRKRIKI